MKRIEKTMWKSLSVLQNVLCALCILWGCSDEDEISKIIPSHDSEVYFNKSLDFTSDSGDATITFTTNNDWTINLSQSGSDISWCTIYPQEGKAGENQIRVSVTENTGFDDRNVTLILRVKDLTKKITVTQKQKDAITLTTAKFELDRKGGKIQVNVKANIEYDVIIPEQYDWIHKEAISPNKCIFKIDESEEYNKREGEIIFQSGELKEIVRIYQSGGGILLLNPNEYFVSDKGEDIIVELKSNCEFGVEMPTVNWITLAQTRNVSSHTLYYNVAPNTSYEKREAYIIYYDKNDESVTDTLHIIQSQKDAIILSKKHYEVSSEENFIEVSVNSNVDYTINMDDNVSQWIKKLSSTTNSRSLVQKKHTFQISENLLPKERKGNVFFISSNLGVTDTLLISQNAKIVEDKHVTINIEKEGTLRGLLGVDASIITHLKVNGPINGTDLRLLREMAGIDYYDNATDGQLRELDLSQAKIRSGGAQYKEWRSSENIAGTIPNGCFMYSNLVSIICPNITSFENQAFAFSKKLKNISIPKTCHSINYSAFEGTLLESINIQNVTYFAGSAFEQCYNLTSINVASDNEVYSSIDGVLYRYKNLPYGILVYCPAGKKEINIPKDIKTISSGAFEDCIFISEIFIPENVSDIQNPYFSFNYMENLSSIHVDPNNQTYASIDGVLYSKDLLELLACPNLKDALDVPNGVKIISMRSFFNSNLKTIKMPNSVFFIGEYAFYGCEKLQTVSFSENITDIERNAFYNCKSLTSISLPKSLINIGSDAFGSNISEIYSWAENPPLIEDDSMFSPKAIVYVPKGCSERYKADKVWGKLNIIEMD